MNDTCNAKKDKKQHIQVFVRVRPINHAEKASKSLTVVETPSNKEVVVRERLLDKYTKKFTFDKVFGPTSKQVDIYNAVVSPLLEEVFAGYNCTVFAYGQTGTGKTFTMEGDTYNDNHGDNNCSLNWQSDTNVGIIPRALGHLFDGLHLLEVQEYTVRVSFLELYNEEIFDLLSSNDDVSKIKLYEDSTKKGIVIVHGLEEVIVHNKTEIYKILQKGSEKRQTAATLMNAHSSRSHTILSITVHIKDNTVEGEELLKTGKLNLVDLAGSENVGRSGAVERRAREAGNINQSLLTLGRVITALVERAPHIPYRESKLTRLLQESLGGRTKTSIIATISPASINLEETLSTLDYAHRAKNITNRPEINQKFSKIALLQEYTQEIERLRKDLVATREKNGVYLANEDYNEMQMRIQQQAKEEEEKVNHIKALQEMMEKKENIFLELQIKHCEQRNELYNMRNQLQTIQDDYTSTVSRLKTVSQEKEEQVHLVETHVCNENILLTQANGLLNVAETASSDVSKLHDKILRKRQVEQHNNYLAQQFRRQNAKEVREIEDEISMQTKDAIQSYTSLKQELEAQTASIIENIDQSAIVISEELCHSQQTAGEKLTKEVTDSFLGYEKWLAGEIENALTMAERERSILSDISTKLAPKLQRLIENKIAQNLNALSSNLSQQIDNLLTCTKRSVLSMRDSRLKQREHLLDNMEEIKKDIEVVVESQAHITKKQENFTEAMKGLQLHFNDLRKEEERSFSMMSNAVACIDKACSDIVVQNIDRYNTSVKEHEDLDENIRNDLEAVKDEVVTKTDECRREAEDTIVQGNILLNELQTNLSQSCVMLKNYENNVDHFVKDARQKVKADREIVLDSVNNIHTIVSNACDNHAKCLEAAKTASLNATAQTSKRFEEEIAKSTHVNNEVIVKLHEINDRVNKFFVEELCHDTPTGLTPAKKEFRYPNKLMKTSPHERILKRFRETRRDIDSLVEKSTATTNANTSADIRDPIEELD